MDEGAAILEGECVVRSDGERLRLAPLEEGGGVLGVDEEERIDLRVEVPVQRDGSAGLVNEVERDRSVGENGGGNRQSDGVVI